MTRNYDLSCMPASEMLRSEHACDDAWIKAFLERVQVGHIGSLWDDQPFVTPTTFWYDPENHAIFLHTNVVGRLRANSERHPRVCFEASAAGEMLPSNIALEFSIQYESVIAFGKIRVLLDPDEKRRALYGLIQKYFPEMKPGEHYRPITDQELKRTAVYSIAIDSWSGKRNWSDAAEQSPDWAPLSVHDS